jgi:hypothetical protein
LHPLESAAFARRTPKADIDRQTSGNLAVPILPLDKVQLLYTRTGVTDITSTVRTLQSELTTRLFACRGDILS